MQMTRRKFLRLMAAAGAEVGTFALGGAYTIWAEPYWLSVERVTVALAGLPDVLNGLTIAQISDLHVGHFLGQKDVARAVDVVLSLRPSLVVVTGDYVTIAADHAGLCAPELARLHAPLGVFFILGNHDHWTNAPVVTRILRDAGLDLLINEGRLVESNGAAFWLAGVDDVWERHADLDRALAGAPKDVLKVLLAHEPDYADAVAADGRVSLQLSGHSHGGQVRFPFVGSPVLPYLATKYPYGLRGIGRMWLYTNRGIGIVSPPVRLNCRPEVTLFSLTADK
jgi:predicted MPP superfamily phosphohydrolase